MASSPPNDAGGLSRWDRVEAGGAGLRCTHPTRGSAPAAGGSGLGCEGWMWKASGSGEQVRGPGAEEPQQLPALTARALVPPSRQQLPSANEDSRL